MFETDAISSSILQRVLDHSLQLRWTSLQGDDVVTPLTVALPCKLRGVKACGRFANPKMCRGGSLVDVTCNQGSYIQLIHLYRCALTVGLPKAL